MPKSRLSAVLSLLLVFFSGAVLGAFAYRLYSISPVQSGKDPGGPPRKMSPEEFRKKYVSDLVQRGQTRQSADHRPQRRPGSDP